ncbi:MAG: sigma 54-interacting transcriptional regulator [Planctomycetota bacterium]
MGRLGVFLLLCGAALAGDPAVPCPQLGRPPRIDGNLAEPAWQAAGVSTIDAGAHIHPNYRAGWTGPEDLSARLQVGIVAENLYLGLEVRDETTRHESGRSWWAGDSVEIFFDTDRQSEEDNRRYTNDDLQLFLMPFHERLRWGVVARGPDVPYPDGGLRGLEMAHRRTADGYTLEVRIPLFNLEPLRPDGEGRIGFDLALNDVDTAESMQAETYMTLSGRFDLHATPANFAHLHIGRRDPTPPEAPVAGAPLVDWGGLFLGLAAVVLVAFAARGAVRRVARRTRLGTATLCGLFAAGAALCSFLPALAKLLDERATRSRWSRTLRQVEGVATTHLDLDTGGNEERAERLVSLLRDGRVRIRPPYRFGCVPLTEQARRGPASDRAPGPLGYGIRLGPGQARSFPLEALPTPQRLRLDLVMPEPEEREQADEAAAEIRLELDAGPPVRASVPHRRESRVLLDTSECAGEPMRRLIVRNHLPFRALVVEALYGESTERTWQALPLAAVARAGVPLDIWHDRPATHIVTVPRGGTATVQPVALSGHRLWLAVGAAGAYPATPYGVDVATVRVSYAQGRPGPELRLVNGRDLENRLLSYARTARRPESIALQWEDSVRRPVLFTLHSLAIDPTRPVARIEVTDLGILEELRLAAATVGHRRVEAPPGASGLKLQGDVLSLRDEVRAGLEGLGFAVRSPAGATGSAGRLHAVRAEVPLAFGEGAEGTLAVHLPHSSWWAVVMRYRSLIFGIAALLLAFAAVIAGAALLYRARHLRVKMLATLGAATVVPLLFLVVSLIQVLNETAERELEEATRTDLRDLRERLAAAKARARELAVNTRDTLELLPENDVAVLRRQMDRSRQEIEAQGAFLRLPDLEAAGPSPLGNVSFFDAVTRSGLYYSPWDGLVALGLARTARESRCLVGLPAAGLLGAAPREEVAFVLYGPAGDPLAATGGKTQALGTASALGRSRVRLDRLTRSVQPLYEGRAKLMGEEMAAAHALIKDGGRVVGLLGVYRSRAATESRKAAVLRTLLLSTLAALLLVVLAGGTLVDRVTARLQRVTRAARAVAQGDLSSRAPVEAEDEVGRLAASFNTMADALDDRVRQLTELHRGLQELTAALDRDAVARAAVALLARATGARHVVVAAVEPATDRLQILHRRGEGAPLGHRLPERGPARDAVELKRPLLKEGAIFLPLVAAGRTVGLALCSPVGTEPDRAFLDLSGRQIGIALENARLYHAAVTDELTGLYTQAFLVRRLKEEVDRAAATGRSLSLLRLVIADFRAIARRHGAAVAAKLVVETATTIDGVLPRRNMLARGQAGELLALLVESDANAARLHLDRVAVALQRHDFVALAGEPKPTLTYRSVTYPQDGAAADILLDSLFEVTETWDESSTDTGPLLKVPPGLDLVRGRSATMRAALEVVARVAPTNATVLLSGETGSGKEVLADLIQANSDRRDRPYVKVNCAAIPDTLVETELFGHERGAFTGAERRRIGRFERAHRGTLFLDEVGDLPLPTQVKLLRVLQERRVTRVGASQSVDVDVRILAASNRDLGVAVRRREFREDLFHRLHVIELRVPPLRERREDIPELIEGFRQEFNRQHRLGIEAIAPDALDALYRYDWPGNVRELRNVVERSMLLAGSTSVERRHLALRETEEERLRAPPAPPSIEGLTPRQERILSHAREKGGVTNGEVVREERVSARTALRELQRLVERGLLLRVGRRRGAVYRPP